MKRRTVIVTLELETDQKLTGIRADYKRIPGVRQVTVAVAQPARARQKALLHGKWAGRKR